MREKKSLALENMCSNTCMAFERAARDVSSTWAAEAISLTRTSEAGAICLTRTRGCGANCSTWDAAVAKARAETGREESRHVVDMLGRMKALLRNVRSTHGLVDCAEVVASAVLFSHGLLAEHGITLRETGLDRSEIIVGDTGPGMTTREIAGSLGISVHTANTHRKSIVATLGVVGAELVRQATLSTTTAPAGDTPAPWPR